MLATEEEELAWYLPFDAEIDALEVYYIVETQRWVEYKNGVYLPLDKVALEAYCQTWLDQQGMKHSVQKQTLLMTRLKNAKFAKLEEFDEDPQWLNCKNGWVDLRPPEVGKIGNGPCVRPHHIEPHSKMRKSLVQINANYQQLPKDTHYWDRVRAEYPLELFKLERFLQTILRKDMTNELMCWVYGRTGSGKGTVLSVVNELFGNTVSHKDVDALGKSDFGLHGLENKLVNLELEGLIAPLKPLTVKYLKKIVGMDKTLEINSKGVQQYDHDFTHLFFISAYNQLPQLPATDVKAWFRRCWLVNFDKKTMDADPTMKQGILNEIDAIFTELVNMPYNFLKPVDVETFWKENMRVWEYSSRPVMRICKRFFVRDPIGMGKLKVDDIYAWVDEAMCAEGQGIANSVAFKSEVTNVLNQMGVYRCTVKNIKSYYPLKIIDPELLERVRAEREMEEAETEGRACDLDTLLGKGGC